MYGIFHVELQRFIEAEHGHDTWTAILKEAGLEKRFYLTVSTYLDSEIDKIIETTSALTHIPPATLMEDFGVFIAPTLQNMYQPLINPRWNLMEFLLNVEDRIHRTIRAKIPGAQPPKLLFQRVGPNAINLHYNSPRRMSAMAKGIIKGMAECYGETITLQEHGHDDGSLDLLITIGAPADDD